MHLLFSRRGPRKELHLDGIGPAIKVLGACQNSAMIARISWVT